jgi:hypothetical protein
MNDLNIEIDRQLEMDETFDIDMKERLKFTSQIDDETVTAIIEKIMNLNLNPWVLPFWSRERISNYFLRNKPKFEKKTVDQLLLIHKTLDDNIRDYELQIDVGLLKQAEVVGMTLSGYAKYSHLMKNLKSEVLVMEDASEILEAQSISILSPYLKHLILIGDHKQLRPKNYNYELQKNFNFNVSLFERLINNDIEYVLLNEQRRMRPSISEFVRKLIYEGNYTDHEIVKTFEDVKGIKSNIYFINHSEMEECSKTAHSRINNYEASYVISLAEYIVKQGYEASKITILTFYLDQLTLIKNLTSNCPALEGIVISTIDNYQGEENDIVLLSLVRSNTFGHVGILNDANRVCVSLSRARKGLYVVGNIDFLSANSSIWSKAKTITGEKGYLVSEIILECQKHQNTTTIRKAVDFAKAETGGCYMMCDQIKSCGHRWFRKIIFMNYKSILIFFHTY